jgi:DNA-binding FadR family transcriptional regulator
MKIEPVQRESIAENITRQLVREILAGRLAPGERLPGERELAQRFHTNRNTLREAVRNLEMLNLIESRQGEGMRVRDFRREGELNLLPWYLRFGGEAGARWAVLADSLRVRRALMVEAVGMAAVRAEDSEVAAMRGILAELSDGAGAERFGALDLALSRALVDAAHSLVARWFFNSMVKVYEAVLVLAPGLAAVPPGYVESMTGVLDAVAARDPELAQERMARHFARVDGYLGALFLSLEEGGE